MHDDNCYIYDEIEKLCCALETGKVSEIKELLEKFSSVRYYSLYCLRQECYSGNFKKVKLLIDGGIKFDNTAFIKASMMNNFEIVKYLIEKGGDKNILSNPKIKDYLNLIEKIRRRKAIVIQRWWRNQK